MPVPTKRDELGSLYIRHVPAIHQLKISIKPTSISNGAQYVTPHSKIYCKKKWKCAGLAQEIGFSAPDLWILPWLVKGTAQLCSFKKERNKLDLTAAQYFWLVDHNDWSRCFAVSSPHIYGSSSFIDGVAKKKTAKLWHLILLSRGTYWAPVENLHPKTVNNSFMLKYISIKFFLKLSMPVPPAGIKISWY